jgi:Protein of unknown function (DUF2490)
VRRIISAALGIVSSAAPARAQTIQVWPEISVFTRLKDRMRFYFLATTVKESRESTEGEFGPNFDVYLRPFKERKRLAGFRLDESKNRFLLLRVGYRHLDSFSGDPDEHRVVLEATPRYPLKGGVLVSNRGRVDARSIDGEYSWRFRSRLSVEKEFSIGPVTMNPYVRGELFYDSRFDKCSRTGWIGGAAFPLNRHVELEGYFDYQHDTGGDHNRKEYAIGTVLNLYF